MEHDIRAAVRRGRRVSATTTTVAVERHELVSRRPFDDVLAAVDAGLGHPDFAALTAGLAETNDWDRYRELVAAEAGTSGLMVFLRLDLGAVVAVDPDAHPFRAVRIIAGNPVTMESMVRSTPGAGAFAPVTLLLFEAADGVHLRYDTVTSAVGDGWDPAAKARAADLDAAVLTLLRSAA
jgi:uncharacterized protein (DUF302 family)